MIARLKQTIQRLLGFLRNDAARERILMNQGRMMSTLNQGKNFDRLCDYEWTVFSQWGEDGIIDFLVSEVPIANTTFIEFGVENFTESNCRFLLMNRNWKGFVIDGSAERMRELRRSYYFWKYDLQNKEAFITSENINELLLESGFEEDLGILSVDIDGNDYHVLKSVNVYDPRIVICEFNPIFGSDREVTVPYDPEFVRTGKHYTNLYYGASIAALTSLMAGRGYTLVGTGLFGANAFFVKSTLLTPLLRKHAEMPLSYAFNWRESRDQQGRLTHLRGEARLKAIKGMEVENTKTGQTEVL